MEQLHRDAGRGRCRAAAGDGRPSPARSRQSWRRRSAPSSPTRSCSRWSARSAAGRSATPRTPSTGVAVWGMTARVLGGLGAHLGGRARQHNDQRSRTEDVVTSTPGDRHGTEEPFETVNADATLRGTLTLPSGPGPMPAMVIAHGASFGLRGSPVYDELADLLLREGVAVLRYDRRGEGKSTGRGDDASPRGPGPDDLLACVRTLRHHAGIRSDRVGLWGISQGSWLGRLSAPRPRRSGASRGHRGGLGLRARGRPSGGTAIATTMRGLPGTTTWRVGGGAGTARRGRWADGRTGLYDTGEAQAVIDSVKGEPWFPLAYLANDLDEEDAGPSVCCLVSTSTSRGPHASPGSPSGPPCSSGGPGSLGRHGPEPRDLAGGADPRRADGRDARGRGSLPDHRRRDPDSIDVEGRRDRRTRSTSRGCGSG